MSNCIYRLTQHVKTTLENHSDKKEMENVCASIAVLYAIKRLSTAKSKNILDIQDEEYNRIKKQFSDLVSCYNEFTAKLSSEQLSQLNELIDDILAHKDHDENMVSWIYQQLKANLAKEALKKLGSDKNKLTGADILVQTQFFTDNYMVKFLVDKVFEIQKDNISNIVFVDPACGGGNFLTYIYSKLFNWYSTNTDFDNKTINELIFKNNILGYDLDFFLSRIAALSLYMCSRLKTEQPNCPNIYVFGGNKDDIYGYLSESISSNVIDGMNMMQRLSYSRTHNKTIVYITNPPFMGRRDMDINLKDYLKRNYPDSKGDLCFSFMDHIIQNMNEKDTFAAVTQNGWLSLSTLKDFRKKILDHYYLHTCIDMGANAFENINGEKTNIVLSIITGKDLCKDNDTVFVNLRGEKLTDKKKKLANGNYDVYHVNINIFNQNPNYEFCYQLGGYADQLKNLHTYNDYSKCMQGSSTGDNSSMVKYIWETNNPEWVLASKGGGYSKWAGLNYYKVKWGVQGNLLKQNKGSALRNPSEIDTTAIVYSDTGTLGLSTRLRLENQVFIASGPGIKVLKGNPICHLAFLNSKIATYFLKVLNPKFTVSAGYISRIPVTDDILDNEFIITLATKCIKLKQEYLSHKLPNFEFVHDNYDAIINAEDYIENCIKQDVFNQYRRYVYEREINENILERYHFNKAQKQEYYRIMGGNNTYVEKQMDYKYIDKILTSFLSDSCQSISRKLNGYIIGTENSIEMISYICSVSPITIVRYIRDNISKLSITKQLYKKDLIHKLILKVIGINSLSSVTIADTKLNAAIIMDALRINYPLLYEQLNITEDLIRNIINKLHKKCFLNRPILVL